MRAITPPATGVKLLHTPTEPRQFSAGTSVIGVVDNRVKGIPLRIFPQSGRSGHGAVTVIFKKRGSDRPMAGMYVRM